MRRYLFFLAVLLFCGLSCAVTWNDPVGKLCIQEYNGVWNCIANGETYNLNASRSYLFEYREVTEAVTITNYVDVVMTPLAVVMVGVVMILIAGLFAVALVGGVKGG